MESDELQLRDLVPADPFIQSPGWPWWAWVLVAVALIGVISLIVALVVRKKSAEVTDPGLLAEEAYHIAIAQIERAAGLAEIQNAATDCSTAIRGYLSKICNDPSLFETHEEFLSRHEALKSFSEDLRKRISTGFSHLASLKYGKSRSGDIPLITNEGRNLLQQIHQHRPA